MAEATIILTADASKAEAELAKFQAQWRAAMTTLTGTVGDTARRVALASGIAFAGQAAVVGLAYSALAQYEFALRQTAVIGGLTEAQMWQLNDAINASAIRWGVAGDEIANGALILAKAGIAGADIIAILDTITASVLANGISWEAAAQAYVVATTAFANQGLTAVEVFDMLQAAANRSLLDVEDFARAFGFAAGSIRLAGGTMEEFLALMVQLVNAGQQAGISARGINQMVINLIENSDQVQAWADNLGLGVEVIKDGQLNLLELVRAFDELGISMDVEQLQTFFTFLNTNAARAFSILLLNANQLPGAIDAITNSTGSLERVAGETAETLRSQWQQVLQSLLIALRNEDVVDALAAAFGTLKEVIASSAPLLKEIVVTVIRDFAANLPQLLDLLRNLLQLASSMLPVWNAFAQVFLVIARAFLDLPGPLQNAIILFALFNRILPFTQVLQFVGALFQLRFAIGAAAEQFRFFVQSDIGVGIGRLNALRAAALGVGLALAGVGTAVLAAGASTQEAAAFYSALTGITWGLAAAQFALMAAEMGVVTLGPGAIAGAAIAAGVLAAISTYIYAAATHKEYARGTEYVPETGEYTLHKGERVLTAEENAAFSAFLEASQKAPPAAERPMGYWPTATEVLAAPRTNPQRDAMQSEILIRMLTSAIATRIATERTRVQPPQETREYHGGVFGGTMNFNFYDSDRDDLRRELARFGL